MKTIVVDDEELSMRQFELECSQVEEIELVGRFTNPLEALEYASGNPVDFALLDIEMPQMNGIELAKKLREINKNMVIIFVSGYSDYVLDALKMKGDYYVFKPYSREDIMDALTRARLLSKGQKKRIFFRTFGRFNVFIDDQLVNFSNAKSKELLALCVDHMGGEVSMEEAVDKLWPEKDYDSRVKALYRKAVIGIHTVMEEHGVPDVFCNHRGVCYIRDKEVLCDYFEYMKDRKNSQYRYEDEYMFEYSWAEETNARLQNMASEY
ncbi:response regulator [Clostridium sp. AM58-1XD]|uniref:response regulator n=1 Tax=Clostridium sp. AM58-1XD TaxID=2292307 RepID=UPI000E48B5A3|nr:response regulator [Clostridium sp. AM58-1XD]RGY98592.1 response regulator [Clostridium sp. AM58-1XD]